VRGFWIAAMTGMAVASGCILIYFLLVSVPRRAQAEADTAATQ
jgi:hypothetical protein